MSIQEFIDWHERTIAQYPLNIQIELRQSRTMFIGKWNKYESN